MKLPNIFRKKKVITQNNKTQEEGKPSKDETNKAEYKIVLLEKLGGTVRVIKELYVQRWKDKEDDVVYLKNDKAEFLEIFPQQMNDFKNYTPDEVNSLVKKHEKALADEHENDDENINDKNIEYELLKLKAKQRSFKFDANASYLSFDSKSRPTFYFLREGSTFFPFKWDTSTKSIFIPSDNRKKSASITLRNKETKYNTKKLLEGGTILLLLLGIIFFGGGGYTWYKASQSYDTAFLSYDESEIAAATRRSLEVANQCAILNTKVAQVGLGIYNEIEDELGKNQTIIVGITPE